MKPSKAKQEGTTVILIIDATDEDTAKDLAHMLEACDLTDIEEVYRYVLESHGEPLTDDDEDYEDEDEYYEDEDIEEDGNDGYVWAV